MFPGFNTASGKRRCNQRWAFIFERPPDVSIPQAVSAVATIYMVMTDVDTLLVSIPQAVSTVATRPKFNATTIHFYGIVSIPQAVSAVATRSSSQYRKGRRYVSIPQAVSTVATHLYRFIHVRIYGFQCRKR